MLKTHQEQLRQLLTATHDGNLISKDARDYLVTCGYAQRRAGWNIATPWGVEVAANLKLTASNTEAVKRPHPFTVIKVNAWGICFPAPAGSPEVNVSHDKIAENWPEKSILRNGYSAWVIAALKATL